MDRPGHEGEQGWVVERIDIMEGNTVWEPKLAYQSSHYVRVILCKIGFSIVF